MMKRFLTAAMVAAVAMPAVPSDRAMFQPQYATTPAQQRAPMIPAGSAPIDSALAQIVPAPYQVLLDDTIPASVVLVWQAGDNWMEVLTRALAPIGLMATPDWSKNTVTVSAPAAPVQRTVPTVAPAAQPKTAPVRAAYYIPDSPNEQPRLVIEQPQKRGGFVAVKRPTSDQIQGTPLPAPTIERESVEADPITVKWDAALPPPDEMWRLMQAAVRGKLIVLTGYSGVKTEEGRVRNANNYAKKMRNSLMVVGFPATTLLVRERASYESVGDKPRIEIVIMEGGA